VVDGSGAVVGDIVPTVSPAPWWSRLTMPVMKNAAYSQLAIRQHRLAS